MNVNPVAIAVMAGLAIGKPVGIFLLSWPGIKLDLARRPCDVSWTALLGGGTLAGIGF